MIPYETRAALRSVKIRSVFSYLGKTEPMDPTREKKWHDKLAQYLLPPDIKDGDPRLDIPSFRNKWNMFLSSMEE